MLVGDEVRRNAFLRTSGLAQAHECVSWTELSGGVSSDIWRVDLPGRSICVKRARRKLKVESDWEAPVSRNTYEWLWLRFAVEHQSQAVPQPLAHDGKAGLLAMSFLAPDRHPAWKTQLLAGSVDPEIASQVGNVLARLHNASFNRADIARTFDSLENFHALRIEPYLLATASRHPDLADRLLGLAERTSVTRLALVHGDVSPKNILVGPAGPIFLDAECAWFGDPAFDLAFCLNHLLLKTLAKRECSRALLQSFSGLVEAYFATAIFEPRLQVEERVADLLPALMLARIDGKSPVEYLTQSLEQDFVRRVSRSMLTSRGMHIGDVAAIWRRALL